MQRKKLSFSQFEIAHLEHILPVLEKVFQKLAIDFYILGGLARDINLLSEGLNPQRITRDVDVAVFIPEPSNFEAIMRELVQEQGFERVSTNPVRLVHVTGVVVDILPFDEMTSKDLEMMRFGPAFANFNLKGLREVYEHGLKEFSIEDDHRYKVTTPEAIVLLKFLAYEDKPDWRQKDLEDIGQLLRYYFDLSETNIYENHNDLFENESTLEAIAARVIGRQLKPILEPNEALRKSFQSIINKYIQPPFSKPVLALAREMSKPPENVVQYLQEILLGLNEGVK